MDNIVTTFGQGLPLLISQFFTALALLGVGIACYILVTPFDDRRLVREGNLAASILIAGTLVALSLPLAATLATSEQAVDILLWGLVALAIQLLTFVAVTALMPGFRAMVVAGNAAASIVLVGIQIAVALLNAAAMAG